MATRAAKKSASKSVTGRPFRAGPDPRRGRGPKKGAPNAGRPPDAYRDFIRAILADPKADGSLERVLTDHSHPAYATMWKAATDRAYGKAPQPLTGADGEGPVAVEVTRRIVRPPADT